MLIVDAHEDLANNMLTFGRDYTMAAADTRRNEAGKLTPQYNGDTLLGWPEYQHGRVALVFSTLFAAPFRRRLGEWDTQCYRDAQDAHRLYRAQVDTYRRLVNEHPDKFRLVLSRQDCEQVLSHWEGSEEQHPVGLVMLMEGAEGVRSSAELADWWQWGVRIIGPAWAGTRYCGGTNEPGPLTSLGYELLNAMAEFGITLDISHMDEQSVLPALDIFPGRVIASHANALALLPGIGTNRHLSDRVLRGLIEREAVIGVVPFNVFLEVGWKMGDSRLMLQKLFAHIDYICQIAGDARHVGIGTDFDGGFGLQSVPMEIDTITDMRKLISLLRDKGYLEDDIARIMGQNWIDLLRDVLPG